jgi:hypothetical protein
VSDELQATKIKAGQMLSKFVKEIADETTELVKDPATGEDRMATKAEALARLMWKGALGYTEIDVKTGKEIIRKPDKTFIGMIWDRVEGRVVPVVDKDKGQKASLADRVGDQAKRRLNTLAE